MKNLIILFALISIASCGPSYCDECVETEHTVTSSTGLANLSITSANIVTEQNTYYRLVIKHEKAIWSTASMRIYKNGVTFLDLNEEVSLNTSVYNSEQNFTYLSIPISGINDNGEFPTDQVYFEGTLSSSNHTIEFSGSTHFYKCESIIEDFDPADCRYSCQIESLDFGEYNCESQLCPI
jgi:hypothetical protein